MTETSREKGGHTVTFDTFDHPGPRLGNRLFPFLVHLVPETSSRSMRLALVLGCDPHHSRHSFEKQALQWERRTERRRQRPANKPGSRSRRTAKALPVRANRHTTQRQVPRAVFGKFAKPAGWAGELSQNRFRGTTTLVQLTGSMETADTEGSFGQGTYARCTGQRLR